MRMAVKDTGCFKNVNEGKCKVFQKFPHPLYVCGVDEHESIAIIDLEQALTHLYEKCPLKDEDGEDI